MEFMSTKIEDIILQHDQRGMSQVHPALTPGYCQRAARMILNNKGVVLIGTGFPVSGSFESDGPIGAIALYRVLARLNCNPVFACAPPISKILAQNFMTHELPLVDCEKSKPVVMQALKDLDPSLIISIERPGVTADGRYYNMHKKDITELTAKFDLFFQESKCPCIAFGDGGRTGCERETGHQGVVLPEVSPQSQSLNRGIVRGQVRDHFPRIVRASVVDQDELIAPGASLYCGSDFACQFG